MRRTWAMAALVAAATFAVFAPVLNFAFVGWDDPVHFLNVPHYRGFAWENIRWMFTSMNLGLYQPLSWLSYAVDFRLWGLSPRGHHFTNLLLHCANAALVYLIAGRLLAKSGGDTVDAAGTSPDDLSIAAAAAALFFALHPLRVEVVAWVTQRRELLAAFFALGSVWAYIRWVEEGSNSWHRLSFGLFAAGLLSKATVMCLPLALLALDYFPLRRSGWPRLGEKIPYFIASLIAAAAAYLGQVASKQIAGLAEYGWTARACQTAYALAFYIWKTLIPAHLLPLYEFPRSFDPFAAPFIASIAAILLTSGIVYRLRQSAPAAGAAFSAYFLLSLPVIGIAKTGDHLAADRFTYLPCAPFALLFGGGLLILLRSRVRLPALALSFAALVLLAGLSRIQASIWRDSKSLWSYTLSIDPSHAVAHNSLGTAFAEEGRFKEAAEHCAEAVRLKPRFTRAWDNLGRALARQRRFTEALQAYDSGLAVSPKDAALRANKAAVLSAKGRIREAVALYRQSLDVDDGVANVHYNLGVALLKLGDNQEALFEFSRARKLGLKTGDLLSNLGLSLARLGRMGEAEGLFREALALEAHPIAHFNLFKLLARTGRKAEAAKHLREAQRLDPSVDR